MAIEAFPEAAGARRYLNGLTARIELGFRQSGPIDRVRRWRYFEAAHMRQEAIECALAGLNRREIDDAAHILVESVENNARLVQEEPVKIAQFADDAMDAHQALTLLVDDDKHDLILRSRRALRAFDGYFEK